MPPKKMTANPLAPLRYRPGKPTAQEEPSSDSESEFGSENEADQQPTSRTAPLKASSFPKISAGLSKEQLEKRRQEAIAAQAREAELASKAEDGFETASASDDDQAKFTSDDDDENSDQESSQDEAPQRKFIAPTFVKKNQRKALSAAPERTAEKIAAEEERRRQEKANEMLQAQIEKDMAERAANRRAWDDDDEAIAADVDDTDDVDPEAERAAWKLRELKRVKREREVIEVAEKEREEVERRRNLSAAEREAEDKEYIEAQKAEQEGKGQMGFMQKYFHKGAFFQGEGGEAEEAAKRRDIMGARYADDAVNRELLPQYMQIRDMTKLGRKGRTKYRDMKTEDTGRWGGYADMKGSGGAGDRYSKQDQEGPSGANASAVGERKRRDDDRQGGRDEKRPRFDR